MLLDTHVWAWSMVDDTLLSSKAVSAIRSATSVAVSVISLYEIGQKVRLGKWSEMAPLVSSLIDVADQQGVSLLQVTPEVSLAASRMSWPHRDPFDRFIVAATLAERRHLISADAIFDGLTSEPNWSGRIW